MDRCSNPGAPSRRDTDLVGLVNVGPNSKRTAAALCGRSETPSQASVSRVRIPHGTPALPAFGGLVWSEGSASSATWLLRELGTSADRAPRSSGSVDRGLDSGLTRGMLRSNADQFTPAAGTDRSEAFVALRLLATVLSGLAVLALVIGVLIAVFVLIAAVGSAGAVGRFAPAAASAGIAGAGLLGALVIFLVTALQALFLWAGAQMIRVVLSLEDRAREGNVLQRAMLVELRRLA